MKLSPKRITRTVWRTLSLDCIPLNAGLPEGNEHPGRINDGGQDKPAYE